MPELAAREDFVWRFDTDAEGKTAVEFWQALSEIDQSIELLLDLLLVEIEKNNDPIDGFTSSLKLLQRLSATPDIINYFVQLGYNQLIELGLTPQWSDFKSIAEHKDRPLRYHDEPIGLGELVADRFIIEQRVGDGSFGVVFRAEERETKSDVALKIPKPLTGSDRTRTYEMLSSEAIVAELIQSSSSPRSVELILDRGMPILVMPFIDGPTLRELINRGPLPPEEAVRIMIEVFSVLDQAHQQKVLHRDVKPENILLNSDGDVFLTDFGLVLFEDDEQIGREGEVAGTLGYQPPDALLGDAHVLDGRVDVWAGGMVLYECLTSRRFDVGTSRESALVSAIVSSKMVPNFAETPEISPELQAICQRCLEPNPLHRYASTREVVEALKQATRPDRQWNLHPSSLSAWRFGLLFGKYSRSRSYFTAFENGACPNDTGLMMMQAFGLQETLNDLRRAMMGFWEDPKLHKLHLSFRRMPIYPNHATVEIRKFMYDGSRGDVSSQVPDFVTQMDEWLGAAFDSLQGSFENTAEPVLALFEFGYLAEQSVGAFGVRTNLSTVAQRTELPENVWEDFCEQVQHPEDFEQSQLQQLCQQLTKQVERFLLFEAE